MLVNSKKNTAPKHEPVRTPIGRIALIALGLAILTLSVYVWTVGNDFINLDDNCYVFECHPVTAGLNMVGVRWAFTTFWQLNWHPLTWISLMADGQMTKWTAAHGIALGNKHAWVYHLTNVILHIANVAVLFILLNSMTGKLWRSAFVAALFGLHPMHVESVAWAAERKDVLSALFWLLTMLAYARYSRAPSIRRYLPVVGLYAMGLMSKPMLVSLPLVLLLMDLWPLNRLNLNTGKPWNWNLIWEKVPLLLMAAGSCVVTIMAQRSGGGVVPFDILPVGIRAANASVSGVEYVVKMLWPVGLACLYPHPIDTIPTWMVPASAVGLAAMTAIALKAAKSRSYVTAGWLWYLITLVPVCGLVQVGRQALADRYSYIPLIGLFFLIAWIVPDLISRTRILAGLAAVIVVASGVAAYKQVGYWQDSVTLMTHAIEVTRGNCVAENNLGQELSERQDTEGAMIHVRRAILYNPGYMDALYNLGTLLCLRKEYDEAEEVLDKVIAANPKHAQAHNNLGLIMIGKHDLEGAIRHFSAATECDPTNETAAANLARALAIKRAHGQ